MKISKSNFILWLIRSTFKGNYPKDLCSFFWSAVLSYLFFLPLFWWHLWHFICFKVKKLNDYWENNNVPWIGKTFITIAIWFFSFPLMFKLFGKEIGLFEGLLFSYLLIPILIIAILIILLIAAFIASKIQDWYDINYYKKFLAKPKQPKKYWLVEAIKSFKEKNCKIIQYE